MGACYDSLEVKAKDDAEATAMCNSYIDQCIWEDGHSPYSGTMGTCYGVRMTTLTFNTSDEAHDYLEENTEKRGNVLGVKIATDDELNHYVFGALCGS